MADKLKPISELQRKFLAKLGETPAEHQAKISAIINKTYTSANSTSKAVNVHVLNKQTEAKLTYSEPVAEIARRIEGTAYIAEDWVPQAYVLFVRRWRCTCGQTGRCLESGQLFLRHRRSRRTREDILSGHSSPYLYLPVKVLAYPNLPRVQESKFVAQVVCEECFSTRSVECQTAKQSSSTDSIESSTSIIQTGNQDGSSIEPSMSQQDYLSYMRLEDDGGCSFTIPSWAPFGSECEKSSLESAAPAAPTNIPTTEVRANV